ncbi:hypothetical protein C8R42DRAFT_708737 [Lentinula raphanica]|nr:hypothetical protein C8R42DRAFT_708737 [Lentinula raphanica]
MNNMIPTRHVIHTLDLLDFNQQSTINNGPCACVAVDENFCRRVPGICGQSVEGFHGSALLVTTGRCRLIMRDVVTRFSARLRGTGDLVIPWGEDDSRMYCRLDGKERSAARQADWATYSKANSLSEGIRARSAFEQTQSSSANELIVINERSRASSTNEPDSLMES